jgi:coatomer protein complex subunit gamma
MEEAVSGVVKFFGMSVCDGTDKIIVTEKVHSLLMSGLFLGSEIVLVRAQIGFNQEFGCVLKVTIRSLNEFISNTLLECIN